jgi:hypothetical protein
MHRLACIPTERFSCTISVPDLSSSSRLDSPAAANGA